jgi:protein phosphatase inhibitor 2
MAEETGTSAAAAASAASAFAASADGLVAEQQHQQQQQQQDLLLPPHHSQQKPVKPALSVSKDGKKKSGRTGQGGGRKKGDIHLKWDEAKIKEHDELRGTRMKIDEPNTPYHQYDSGSETDGSIHSARHLHKREDDDDYRTISWDTLQNKLEAHAAVREAYPSSPSSYGGGGGDPSGSAKSGGEDEEKEDPDARAARMKEELKELEFKEHRKRHYNEMELVRRYRQEHANDDDDMDDDEDDTGGNGAALNGVSQNGGGRHNRHHQLMNGDEEEDEGDEADDEHDE